MDHLEFKQRVDNILRKYQDYKQFNDNPNDKIITKNLCLSTTYDEMSFTLYSKLKDDFIYESSQYDNPETLIDDLSVFIELILPKYL